MESEVLKAGENERKKRFILNKLNNQGIKFALSNVLEHKGKENKILKNWIETNNYQINYFDYNYSNSNYQTIDRNKNSSVEVLITNYETPKLQKQKTLFD